MVVLFKQDSGKIIKILFGKPPQSTQLP